MLTVAQHRWVPSLDWHDGVEAVPDAQLVMTFGARQRIDDPAVMAPLRARYPRAHFFGCSTSGEIAGTTVSDDSVVASALRFERTGVRLAATALDGEADSHAAGRRLAAELSAPDLAHVFVLSDGLAVNGSRLAEGLAAGVGDGAVVTGGWPGTARPSRARRSWPAATPALDVRPPSVSTDRPSASAAPRSGAGIRLDRSGS